MKRVEGNIKYKNKIAVWSKIYDKVTFGTLTRIMHYLDAVGEDTTNAVDLGMMIKQTLDDELKID